LSVAEWVEPQWQPRLHAAGLNSLRDLLDHSPTELNLAGNWSALTKPGLAGRQRWRWELPGSDGQRQVLYVKRYQHSPWKAEWDRIARQSAWHSRAWWEFRQCQRLGEGYIPTPHAVGAAEAMCGLLERRSVLLLEAVPGDGFDRAWTAAARQNAPITRDLARHDLIVRLASLISGFHQSGWCHRDLYLCHVFVDLDLDGLRPPAFTLIDLARTLRPRLRRMRWIIKDLSQLDSSARQIGASRGDRLRFLHAYLGLQSGSPRIRWYARRIVRKSDWILRRLERKSQGQ
jgi:heptose I phosphotransferase